MYIRTLCQKINSVIITNLRKHDIGLMLGVQKDAKLENVRANNGRCRNIDILTQIQSIVGVSGGQSSPVPILVGFSQSQLR